MVGGKREPRRGKGGGRRSAGKVGEEKSLNCLLELLRLGWGLCVDPRLVWLYDYEREDMRLIECITGSDRGRERA